MGEGVLIISFVLFWLSLVSLFVVFFVRIVRRNGLFPTNMPSWNPFASTEKNAAIYREQNKRQLMAFKEIGKYYSTQFGKFHMMAVACLAVTTFASLIWMLIERKHG
ncbi:hypothetical protein AB4Y96_08175 [Phyllobacterium sp. TAF24]|uniref:hypothetical protein n=1 Tax=Phyllobacterium sp. TAF24 TaxID=3233068 RepID=UPI003F9C313A